MIDNAWRAIKIEINTDKLSWIHKSFESRRRNSSNTLGWFGVFVERFVGAHVLKVLIANNQTEPRDATWHVNSVARWAISWILKWLNNINLERIEILIY